MMEAETEVMEAATLGAGGLPLRLSSFVSEVSSPYSVGMLPDSRSLDLVRLGVGLGLAARQPIIGPARSKRVWTRVLTSVALDGL